MDNFFDGEVERAIQNTVSTTGCTVAQILQHIVALVLVLALGRQLRDNWKSNRSIAVLDRAVFMYRRAISLCPPSLIGRDYLLLGLAQVLKERHDVLELFSDLQGVIASHREALSLRPVGHPNRISVISNLASLLMGIHDRLGKLPDLDESIRLQREILAFLPTGHPDRPFRLANYARALNSRYKRLSELSDLEENIRMQGEILVSFPKGHPVRWSALSGLAFALYLRYDRLGGIPDLENCIQLHLESLTLLPEGYTERASILINLALTLSIRFDLKGELQDLEGSIRLQRELLAFRPQGHPDRPSCLVNYAKALYSRYKRLSELPDLVEIIRLYEEMLVSFPESHPDHPSCLNNLAVALSARYTRLSDRSDLEESIRLYRKALVSRPEASPDRFSTLDGLAFTLRCRYELLGELSDLEDSIRLHEEAPKLCPVDDPHRPSLLTNLAAVLRIRYDHLGEFPDLESSIRLHKEALVLRPEDHPDRSPSLDNLASVLGLRYIRLGTLPDLEESVRLHEDALALRPVGHPDRYITLNNLACALSRRYKHFHELPELEKSICFHREALSLCPVGHPVRHATLTNLANVLRTRYKRLNELSDLEQSVSMDQERLDLCPKGNPHRAYSLSNLADGLALRHARLGRKEDLEQAISLVRSSKDDFSSPQAHVLRTSMLWAALAESCSSTSLEEAYVSGVACFRQYLSIGPTAQLQYSALLRNSDFAFFPMAAAAYFIENRNLERAVEVLDESRALLISEMRRFREPWSPTERERIGGDLPSRYIRLCEELRNLSNAEVRFEASPADSALLLEGHNLGRSTVAYGTLVREKRLKMEEYDKLLVEIRARPGCENFQKPLKFAVLKEAAKGGPVIVVNCSIRRSDVIIVFSHRDPLLIPLGKDFYKDMQRLHNLYVKEMKALSAIDNGENFGRTMSDILKHTARELYHNVVRFVGKALEENGVPRGSRIWWCPTSFLTALPFHAAGDGNRWLVDRYVSSYTPTLSALIHARQSTSVTHSPRILVVAQTQTSGLENAVKELQVIEKLPSFEKCLDEEAATPQSVAEHLPSYDWVHFTCHGTVADNPFDSFLRLHNRSKLSLNDIVKLHLKDAKFAFLAACHSAGQARGESVLKDEVLHLAAAMQVSGFRSVVGTMWQMEDEDGPVLSERLYKEMLAGEGEPGEKHTRAAEALSKAMLWMKNERRLPIARWANYIHIGA